MAAAAIPLIGAVVGAGASAVIGNQQKQAQKGAQSALDRSLQASIASTPAPPSVRQENADAGLAMSLAAQRARRMAAGAGGASSTILTSGSGAGPANTTRKTLLGQ
jgi:hypothetical protein